MDDKRLIEDYLPIKAISAEASREKSVRKGHISTLHLWWARRPLVACRAAVYGALVPASRFQPQNGPEEKRESLGRANAAKFVERVCKYPGSPQVIAEAQRHILEAHAERLTAELQAAKDGNKPAWVDEFKFTREKVTVDDIVAGRAPRPRVLDMFAGGGSIPLEALRLGCEAYALELNPVAHIIELCTLVYPQKYGKPDPSVRGMTGAKNSKGESTWGGLAEEVRYWGNRVLEEVKAEIGDLYPLVPDPEYKGERPAVQETMWHRWKKQETPPGYLVPIAYLWTRTVRCKNPSCGATVPLVKQTWLCKKKGRYVALRMVAWKGEKRVRFEVVRSRNEEGLGFNPSLGSKAGSATCPFCGTVADSDYVKAEGCAKHMGQQMMVIVCTRPGEVGRVYVSANNVKELVPDDSAIGERAEALCVRAGLRLPDEPIEARMTGGICLPYGLTDIGKLFTPRQTLCLLGFVTSARGAYGEMLQAGYDQEQSKAVVTYLGVLVDRQADYNSSLSRWHNTGEKISATFGRQALPMVWDFAELAPFGKASGGAHGALAWIIGVIRAQNGLSSPAHVGRGSATALPFPEGFFDAVVTDPPYYDNVDYAKLSDFFYAWLKRTIGHLHPEHFGAPSAPKRREAVADPVRHGGNREGARRAYEQMMAGAFAEAHRVLKRRGQMTVVYAHKTTLGWSTLASALRRVGFGITEAWPLNTEMTSRMVAMGTAALASSIFLVARKRGTAESGSYEGAVRPELERIVRERVGSLWEMGVSGADLKIAAVGAGLRAFTRFERVEYANGEQVPAEKFLAEVEGVVQEMMLEKVFGVSRSGVGAVDGASRFYVLWRYMYGAALLPAGEGIVFTYGQPVELDGQGGLSSGRSPLVEKKKDKYRLRDFAERGKDEKLGLPSDDGTPASLIDVLHRALWLMEYQPIGLGEFLDFSLAGRADRLRLVAQALEGAGLSGKSETETAKLISTTTREQAALKKLMQNWRALVEQDLFRG